MFKTITESIFKKNGIRNPYVDIEKAKRLTKQLEKLKSENAQGVIDLIQCCCDPANIVLLKNPRSKIQRRRLWTCNLRVCPICSRALAYRTLKKIRKIVHHLRKEFPSARWCFITLTLPVGLLDGLDLTKRYEMAKMAFERLSGLSFFGKSIRGCIQKLEINADPSNHAMFHIHVLAIETGKLRYSRIKRSINDKWGQIVVDIAKERGQAPPERVEIDIQRVVPTLNSIGKVCTYLSKAIPVSTLADSVLTEIITLDKFPRTLERFGVCRGTKIDEEITLRDLAETPEQDRGKHILDNKDPNRPVESCHSKPGKVSRSKSSNERKHSIRATAKIPKPSSSWRYLVQILPRDEWLRILNRRVSEVRFFRKRQLRDAYPLAEIITLAGEVI